MCQAQLLGLTFFWGVITTLLLFFFLGLRFIWVCLVFFWAFCSLFELIEPLSSGFFSVLLSERKDAQFTGGQGVKITISIYLFFIKKFFHKFVLHQGRSKTKSEWMKLDHLAVFQVEIQSVLLAGKKFYMRKCFIWYVCENCCCNFWM